MQRPLLSYLQDVPDFRRAEGRRYPLAETLVMITMAMMSGCFRFREIGTFLAANCDELCRHLGLQKARVPSYVTVRTIMLHVSPEQLSSAFNRWAHQLAAGDEGVAIGENINIDGKALASTVSEPDNALQSFGCIISAYCQRLGLVIASRNYDNAKRSEVHMLQELVEALEIRGAVLTADALHNTKKHSRRSWTAATTT